MSETARDLGGIAGMDEELPRRIVFEVLYALF